MFFVIFWLYKKNLFFRTSASYAHDTGRKFHFLFAKTTWTWRRLNFGGSIFFLFCFFAFPREVGFVQGYHKNVPMNLRIYTASHKRIVSEVLRNFFKKRKNIDPAEFNPEDTQKFARWLSKICGLSDARRWGRYM